MGTCELCGPNFLFLCPYEDNLNHDNEDDLKKKLEVAWQGHNNKGVKNGQKPCVQQSKMHLQHP
jgi:hypothetical protein